MAWADYKICDHCGDAKVFYDANIEDERYQATWGEPSNYDPIGLKAICGDCNKTHQVVIAPRVLEPAPDLAELVGLLQEARTDLQSYVDHDYPPETCAAHPSVARQHFRDMELCRRIDTALNDGGSDG